MENKTSINESINELTDRIREEYPEMYRFLEETPMDITMEEKNPEVTIEGLKTYFNTLKSMVKQHTKTDFLPKKKHLKLESFSKN